MMRSLSIRWRLTLWYGAATALIIFVFAAGIFVLTARSQSTRIEFELDEEMSEVVSEVLRSPDHDALLAELKAEFSQHDAFEFDIACRDGTPLFLSNRLEQQRLSQGSDWPAQPTRDTRTLSKLGEYHVLRKTLDSPHGSLLLHVAIPLAPMREAQRSLLSTQGLVGPLMLLTALSSRLKSTRCNR